MKPSIFLKDDYKNENGLSPLYLRIFINGSYKKVNLRILASKENWNREKQELINGVDKKEKNLIIKEAVGRAADIILKYQVNKIELTTNLFEKEFNNPASRSDFIKYMEDQIKSRHTIASSTTSSHLSILHKLKEFQDQIIMTELDDFLLKEFFKFLKKRGNKTNTIWGTFKTIKVYTNKAIKEGLIKKDPFLYFKNKKEKTYPTYLTEVERDYFMELYKSNQISETYRKTLRQFLFSCFTGLRVIDIKQITYENIKAKRLIFHPQKTKNINNQRLDIPLCNTALELIDDQIKTEINGKIFPRFAPQRLNYYLKDICKLAKIDKKITMHSGRHTFATIFLRKTKAANGIIILKDLLGHSRIETTMIYSHVISSDTDEAMKEFDS